MKTRRGTPVTASFTASHYETGDMVKSVLVEDPSFTGVVESVDAKTNTVLVSWANGASSQHSPDEIALWPVVRTASDRTRTATNYAIELVQIKGAIMETTPRFMINLFGKPWGELYFNLTGYVAEKGIPVPSRSRPGQASGLSIGEKSLAAYKAEISKANKEWGYSPANPYLTVASIGRRMRAGSDFTLGAGKTAQHLENVKTLPELTEREITRALRDAIIAEEEAIKQYETIADSTEDEGVKKVVQDIADEERVHVGELQEVLNLILEDEKELLDEGASEVEDVVSKTAGVKDRKPIEPANTYAAGTLQIVCAECEAVARWNEAAAKGWTYDPKGKAFEAYFCGKCSQTRTAGVGAGEHTAGSGIVEFLYDNGSVFAVARDADTAFHFWGKNRWDFRVEGQFFSHRDFRGREAIERLFGMKYRLTGSSKASDDSITAKRDVVTITIDERDPRSLSNAERQKARLENAGYTLIDTQAGLTRSQMTYEKKASVKTATGEMGYHDIQPGGEYYETAESIKEAARELQSLTRSGVRFVRMKPFDVYQGPYAEMSSGTLWSGTNDGEFVYRISNYGPPTAVGSIPEIARFINLLAARAALSQPRSIYKKDASVKTAGSGIVEFLNDNGTVFAVARDVDTAFDLWGKHRWNFKVEGEFFRPSDYRGKAALERVFGRAWRMSSDEDCVDCKSRRAMYWCAPDRTYRLTKAEQESGMATCPSCKAEMLKEKFTRTDKLLTCPECGFKVPTSKAVTNLKVTVPEGISVTVEHKDDNGEPVSGERIASEKEYVVFHDNSGRGKSVLVEFPSSAAADKFVSSTENGGGAKHFEVDILGSDTKTVDNWLRANGGKIVRKTGSDLFRHLMMVLTGRTGSTEDSMITRRGRFASVGPEDLAQLPSMSLSQIASLIYQDWRPVNFAAKPYLEAMSTLQSIRDNYFQDRGSSIVAYLLSNMSSYRGPTAIAIKKELNKRLKNAR